MPEREPLLPALGTAVRESRKRQRLTQERLSIQCGIHRNYIGGIERGERVPSVPTIITLAHALETEPSDLFRRAEEIVRRETAVRQL